jgi:hypothetical protein
VWPLGRISPRQWAGCHFSESKRCSIDRVRFIWLCQCPLSRTASGDRRHGLALKLTIEELPGWNQAVYFSYLLTIG